MIYCVSGSLGWMWLNLMATFRKRFTSAPSNRFWHCHCDLVKYVNISIRYLLLFAVCCWIRPYIHIYLNVFSSSSFAWIPFNLKSQNVFVPHISFIARAMFQPFFYLNFYITQFVTNGIRYFHRIYHKPHEASNKSSKTLFIISKWAWIYRAIT